MSSDATDATHRLAPANLVAPAVAAQDNDASGSGGVRVPAGATAQSLTMGSNDASKEASTTEQAAAEGLRQGQVESKAKATTGTDEARSGDGESSEKAKAGAPAEALAPSAAATTPASKDAEVASTLGSGSSAQPPSMSASDASSAAPTTTQSTISKDASTSLASPAANSASLPAPKAASSRGASPAPSSTSSSHPPPVKKFASLNVNKKFLEKSATPSPTLSISKPTAPAAPAAKPPTLPTSRLLTTRLVHPRPIQAASAPAPSSKWGTTPSPKPIGLGAEARGPGMGKASSTPWGDARRQAAAAGALSLEKNFPTTKESAEGKALAQAAKQKAAATSAAAQQARLEELDAFRGAHLNPNAHHWDDVDDEDDNFLDEVVEFGDGTQYKVHENPNPEPESSPSDTEKRESERNAWARKASAPTAPPPPAAPRAPPPSSVLRSPTNQLRSLPPHQSRGSSSAPGGRSRQDESSRVLFNERSNQFESSRMGPAAGARPPLSHPSAMPPSSGRRMSQERAPARGFDRPPPPHVELQRSLPPHLEGQDDSAAKSAVPAPPARSPWGLPREPAGRSSLPMSDPARSGLSPLSQQRGVAPQAAAPSASARGPLVSQSHAFTTGAGPQARRPSATLDRPAAPPSLSPTIATSSLPRKDAVPSPGQESSLATRRLSAAEAAQKMTKEEVEAMQKDEMHSAAERARLRRQEEEEERNAARERAKKKAEELAERFKAKPTETMTPKVVDPSPVAKAEPPKGNRGEPLDMASQRPVTVLAPRALPPNQAPITLRQQQQKSAAPPSGPAIAAVPRPAEIASKKSAALPATPAGPPPPPAAPASAAGSSAPVSSPPVLNPPAASVWTRKGTQLPPPPKIFKNQPVPSDVDVVDFADLGKLVSPTSAPPPPPTKAPALSSAAPAPSSPVKPRRLAAADFFDNPSTSSSTSSSIFKPFPSRLGPQAQAKSDLDLTLPTRPPQTSPSSEAFKVLVPPTSAPACSASQQTPSPSLLSEQVVSPLRSSELSASAPPAQPSGLTPGGFPKVVPSSAKSSFRETGISPASFDDMLLRIKGAMDSGGDVAKASAMSGPVGKGRANDYQSSSIHQPVPKRAQPMSIVPEDIVTRYERPASPPLPWKVYNVRLPKDERKRPPVDPRQAKLLRREMDRIDILTWSPTLYKSLNSKTYSRDDMLLLSMYGRRPGKHIRPMTPIVRLKPVPKGSDRKSKGSSSAPSQPRSSRVTPVASPMPTRPPSPAPVPVILTSVIDQPRTDPAPAPAPAPAVVTAAPAVASAPERATKASPNHSLPAISVQPPTSARAPRPAAGRAMEEASWRRKTVEPPKSVPAKPMTPVWSKEAAVNEAKLDPASSGTLGKVESTPLDAANSISQQISLAKGLPNTSAATLTTNTLQPKAQPSRIPEGNSDVSFYRDRASSIGAQSEEQLAPLVRFMMTSEIDDFKLEELGPKSTEPGRENILEFASIMRSPSSLRETADGDDSTSSVPRLPNNGASLALSPPSEATSSAWSKPLAAPLLNAKEQQVKDVWAQTQDSSTSGPPTQSRMRGAFSSAGGYRYTPPEIAAASSPGGGVGGAFGHRTVSGPGGHVQRPNYGNVGQQQGQQQQPSTPAGGFASSYGVARSASGQPNPAAAPFQPGGGAYSSGRPNPAAPPFHYSGQQARATPNVPARPTFSPYNSNVSLSPSGSSSGYPSPLMNQPPSLSPHPQQQPQQQGQPFRSQQQQQQQGTHPSAVGGAISVSPGSAPFPVGIPQQGGVWLPVSLSTSRPGASAFGGGVVGAGGRLPSPYSPAQALPPGGTVPYSPHQHMRNLSDFSIPSSVAPTTAVGGAGKPSGSGTGSGQPSGMFSNGGRGPLDARTGGGGGPGQQQMHRALLPHLQGPPHMSHQPQHHQQQGQGAQQQQQQQPVFASVASSPGPYGAGAFGYQGVGGTGGGRW